MIGYKTGSADLYKCRIKAEAAVTSNKYRDYKDTLKSLTFFI